MEMTLLLALPEETKQMLRDLADRDGCEPERRVHDILTTWVFRTPPNVPPMVWTTRVTRVHLLLQRGKAGTVTSEEVRRVAAARYQIPNGGTVPTNGHTVVPLGRRLSDVLPLVAAYTELVDSSGVDTKTRGWSDLPGLVRALVIEEVARMQADFDTKDADDETRALFPKEPKPKSVAPP
jgi:hypothetical protein